MASRRPSGGIEIAIKALEIVTKIVGGIFDPRVLLAAIAAVVVLGIAMIAKVPPDKYSAFSGAIGRILRSFGEVLHEGAFCVGGYLVAAVVIAAGTPVVYAQHKRLRGQGEENARLRKLVDPGRLSSDASMDELVDRGAVDMGEGDEGDHG